MTRSFLFLLALSLGFFAGCDNAAYHPGKKQAELPSPTPSVNPDTSTPVPVPNVTPH